MAQKATLELDLTRNPPGLSRRLKPNYSLYERLRSGFAPASLRLRSGFGIPLTPDPGRG